ncbi:M24 family metallopeptidase [Sutcliffiella rhizosphaerae]|uniref:Peptidase M24 domain-containing protein n=1 Tax=Sutcliffiella rhizosphaerae TaxID=2880967 RepID=A0ABM8YMB0_9BACI|nr:M24 family metallopeptidase [Sutcliffiella rhizosphaerae]CAG9621103.1 hypothetical protein BACCIP111883_01875 [Sutcliffiella rhizosphaerae]
MTKIFEDITVSPEQKVRIWLREKGHDGILFRRRNNFSWITEGKVNHIVQTTEFGVADILLLDDKKYCITVKMESRRLMEEELVNLGFELVECEWYESTHQIIEKLSKGKAIVADSYFPGMEDVSSALIQLRSQLSISEKERYEWLCKFSAETLEGVARKILPGMSEYEISSLVAAACMKAGVNPQVILIATDDRIYQYRHPIPTGKKLKKYAMLVLCAEKGGLVANVTRFVHFGSLPEELLINRKKLALIDVQMNVATRPGRKVKDIFQKAVNAYAEAGYPEDWRLLHQGGLTGYASREFLATMNSEEEILVNQAYAWNPAIRGVKSEDTILIESEDNKFLTHTGNWTYIEIEHEGRVYLRPDILIQD